MSQQQKNPLEIELFRYKKIVFGRVVYQDDAFRATHGKSISLITVNGFEIISSVSPRMTGSILYVCGSMRTEDENELFIRCANEKSAQDLCENIKVAVNQFNAQFKPTKDETVVRVL